MRAFIDPKTATPIINEKDDRILNERAEEGRRRFENDPEAMKIWIKKAQDVRQPPTAHGQSASGLPQLASSFPALPQLPSLPFASEVSTLGLPQARSDTAEKPVESSSTVVGQEQPSTALDPEIMKFLNSVKKTQVKSEFRDESEVASIEQGGQQDEGRQNLANFNKSPPNQPSQSNLLGQASQMNQDKDLREDTASLDQDFRELEVDKDLREPSIPALSLPPSLLTSVNSLPSASPSINLTPTIPTSPFSPPSSSHQPPFSSAFPSLTPPTANDPQQPKPVISANQLSALANLAGQNMDLAAILNKVDSAQKAQPAPVIQQLNDSNQVRNLEIFGENKKVLGV